MHAVTCLPALTGRLAASGRRRLLPHLDNWRLDTRLAHGLELLNPATRCSTSRASGRCLCGEPAALAGGPAVAAS